jgi:hypothetical protein
MTGYVAAVTSAIAAAPNKAQIIGSVQNQLGKSFSSAAAVAQQYPKYASAITAGAKYSFLQGADWAYGAGLIATVIGIALVLFLFPGKDKEQRLLAQYKTADSGRVKPSPRRTPGRCSLSPRSSPTDKPGWPTWSDRGGQHEPPLTRASLVLPHLHSQCGQWPGLSHHPVQGYMGCRSPRRAPGTPVHLGGTPAAHVAQAAGRRPQSEAAQARTDP